MPLNTGKPFFHPVTHTLIDTGMWYHGEAHQDEQREKPELTKNQEREDPPQADNDDQVVKQEQDTSDSTPEKPNPGQISKEQKKSTNNKAGGKGTGK